MKILQRLSLVSILLLFVVLTACSDESKNVATSADGVPISFSVYGEGTPAIVLIHGWCWGQNNWIGQIRELSRQNKIITIDLAGFGGSGHGRTDWTMKAFGEDVVSVVEKLGLEQVVLVGFSMGDKVIVEAARIMPERIIGLVGVDNFHNVESKLTDEQIAGFMAPFRADFAGALNAMLLSMVLPNADSTKVLEKVRADYGGCAAPPDIAIAVLENYIKHDMTESLREIKAPIHCINSDFVPTDIEAAQRYVSSFKVEIMSGVGHLLLWEDTATFNRLLGEIVKTFEAS
ncbi:MAG: alpha/beta hydrolase [Candidatus Marinimicrobia bacterium]|nr:alpha/beta hydrolase [Candidatus Neomarinimicrobiota bacterium]